MRFHGVTGNIPNFCLEYSVQVSVKPNSSCNQICIILKKKLRTIVVIPERWKSILTAIM